ncbi:MAG: hypothetical protein AB1656_00455 [Candidatus Omnitrophota bacterium]
MKRIRNWTLWIALLTFVPPAWACRYNVRDVGFVDLQSDPYLLYVYIGENTLDEDVSALKSISFAALLDGNVKTEFVNVDKEIESKGLDYFDKDRMKTLPAAALVSPDGRSLSIFFEGEEKSFKERVWNRLDAIVDSSIRQQIMKQLIECYGVVLLVEGEDAENNEKAKTAVAAAIEKVKKNMAYLPKTVEMPPVLYVLPPQRQSEERILLWSLGIEDEKIQEPCAAALYGRGRLMGSLLRGKAITEGAVSYYLSVIGLNCECGLDRSWMQGRMFPFVWSEELRELAARRLGFDVESPMAKVEISQILSKNTPGNQQRYSDSSVDGVLLGYSEGVLIESPAVGENENNILNEEPLADRIADGTAASSTPHFNAAVGIDPKPSEDRRVFWNSFLWLMGAGILASAAGIGMIVWARRNAA